MSSQASTATASIGNPPGEAPFSSFGEMLGDDGEERGAAEIAPALTRAREAVEAPGKSAVLDTRVDPKEYAPGARNQTMYK